MFAKTTIIGRLGADPSQKFTADGTPVTSFSVATDRSWTKDGQKQSVTTWYRVTAWRRLAETCAQFLQKGKLIYVEGVLSAPRVYEAKDGTHRASLDLTANVVKFLSSRNETTIETSDEGYASEPENGVSEVPF